MQLFRSSFLLIVCLLTLNQCSNGYPNFATVPPRQPERIPLEEVREDLDEMVEENALQKELGKNALGNNFQPKR